MPPNMPIMRFLFPASEPEEEPIAKPQFLRTLSDISATEGQRLVLETEVSAEPEPLVIMWLKDGQELKSSDSTKVWWISYVDQHSVATQ